MLMMLAVVWVWATCGPADAHDAGRGSGSELPAVQLMLMMLAVFWATCGPADAHDAGRGLGAGLPRSS